MTASIVDETVATALDLLGSGALAVAFSGGMDSTVLLHALAANATARARRLRAIHVDHGLHEHSAHWAEHCIAVANALGVPVQILRVDVGDAHGGGLEDAARKARMTAFARALEPGEFLAAAQHRDDQAETVLLKLLRGAGPEGLGAMRTLRALGKGSLWRPLLALPRSALEAYARKHDLRWVEDPSNAQTHIERNFLRAEILPRLRTRWPEVERPLAHSARWLRNVADFIDSEARKALAGVQGLDPATLAWRPWLELPDALRDPVLRLWLRGLGLDEPAHFHVSELERQLLAAAPDRLPCVAFARTELRRYRDLLYAMPSLPDATADWQFDWHGERVDLPCHGELRTHPSRAFPSVLRVTCRRGGERIKPAGSAHTRELRLLLQEAGVPPWQRDAMPLIYRGDELLAVGDLVVSDAGDAFCTALDLRFVWTPDRAAPIALSQTRASSQDY